jgi:hypothetical protein
MASRRSNERRRRRIVFSVYVMRSGSREMRAGAR